MLSSKLNTDLKPWTQKWLDGRITRHERMGGGSNLWAYRPRPELENTPNPILLDFRENRGATGPWLHELTLRPIDAEFVSEIRKAWGVRVTAEHIEHATLVLTRLAALRGEVTV